MPTVRYHALLCRDAAGGYSAVALDGEATGFGATANDARDDLKEYLRWAHRKEPWLPTPDFTGPELRWFTVTVRPEYKAKDRFHPSDAEVPVRVPCVVGTRKSGQFAADLPLLGIRFDYPGRMELQKLIERYVTQALEGKTPEQLGEYLPPPHAELIELAVPVPKEPPGLRDALPPAAHHGEGGRTGRRPRRAEGLRPRLGPRGRTRRARAEVAPREGERAAGR